MPTVILSRDVAQRFTGGDVRIELAAAANTVRAVMRELDNRYPGLGEVLRGPMAVAIDGQIYQDCLLEPVAADSEVCFLPAIDGG